MAPARAFPHGGKGGCPALLAMVLECIDRESDSNQGGEMFLIPRYIFLKEVVDNSGCGCEIIITLLFARMLIQTYSRGP